MIDLKTVLNSKNLSQLKFACQLLNISLQGKIRKADIVDALFDTLCKKETLDFIFQYLEEKNIAFKDMEQCNKFVKAYTDMHNNTRMWENCGNTPNEMRKQMK